MGVGEEGVLAPRDAVCRLCLQAGMEDDGEEVYLPSGMDLVCVLAGGCIFPPQVCVCVVQMCKGQCSVGAAPTGSGRRWQGYGFDPRVCAGGCASTWVSLCVWEEELRVSLPPVTVTGCGCT